MLTLVPDTSTEATDSFTPSTFPRFDKRATETLAAYVELIGTDEASELPCPCCELAFPPTDLAAHLRSGRGTCDRTAWGLHYGEELPDAA